MIIYVSLRSDWHTLHAKGIVTCLFEDMYTTILHRPSLSIRHFHETDRRDIQTCRTIILENFALPRKTFGELEGVRPSPSQV